LNIQVVKKASNQETVQIFVFKGVNGWGSVGFGAMYIQTRFWGLILDNPAT